MKAFIKTLKPVKLLSLVLTLLIAGTVFTACSKNEQAPPVTPSETTKQVTTEKTTKEKAEPGKEIVDIYNAIIKGDYDYVYANSTMNSSDIEKFRQEVDGVESLTYTAGEEFKRYKDYELVSMVSDCKLTDGKIIIFSGVYILKNGKLCSNSSIDSEMIEVINGYIKEYKENSDLWRKYGFDYYVPTTVETYTNRRVVCPLCSGSGVVQEVIGVDANGLPMYSMVGCGGCGASGWINQ